jgi:hypothetical protein
VRPTGLAVSSPGDRFEREADRLAGAAMRGLGVASSMVSRVSPTRAEGASLPVRGPGRPLPAAVRARYEEQFSYDFSRVRIHTDAGAAATAGGLSSNAFTVGHHVAFAPGRYAPETESGRRLLAHELTHVIQQERVTAPQIVQREFVYGSGYPKPWKNDAAEIRSLQRREWSPSTDDFKALVDREGGGRGVATFKELLDLIESRPPGSITELALVGHSNSEVFGLGGKIIPGDVIFTRAGAINEESIAANQSRITPLRNRFSGLTAQIVLYSCDAGVGGELLCALSEAFGVIATGFNTEILYCFDHAGGKITQRGKVSLDPTGAIHAGVLGCADFGTKLTALAPTTECYANIPPMEL